jgi:DNA-binding transcriptional LysR family regulator
VWVVPRLLEHLREQAPGIDLTLASPQQRRLREQLEAGEVDAAIVPQLDEKLIEEADIDRSGLVRRLLFRDQHCCLLRSDHPALQRIKARAAKSGSPRKLSLEAYAALPHLVVSPLGSGPAMVDELLVEHGLKRRISLRVPHFYSALPILARSDLILTAPTVLARLAPADGSIAVLAPPLRLPGHRVHLVWHERFTKDQGHAWLRDCIVAAGQAAERETGTLTT